MRKTSTETYTVISVRNDFSFEPRCDIIEARSADDAQTLIEHRMKSATKGYVVVAVFEGIQEPL